MVDYDEMYYKSRFLMVISLYDPEKNEVAAFEELVGIHGGLWGRTIISIHITSL